MTTVTPQESKRCPHCGETKLAAQFSLRNDRPGQLSAWCKACDLARCNARNAARRAANPLPPKPLTRVCSGPCGQELPVEAFAFKKKSKPSDGRRHLCEDCKRLAKNAYYAANRERRQASERQRYAANPDKLAASVQRSVAKKPDHYRALVSLYKKTHPEVGAASSHKRRAKIKGNGGSWTSAEWKALKDKYDHRCLMCHRQEPEISLTFDHIIPIVKGGPNTIDNGQPLCRSCNSKKHRGIIDLRPLTQSSF